MKQKPKIPQLLDNQSNSFDPNGVVDLNTIHKAYQYLMKTYVDDVIEHREKIARQKEDKLREQRLLEAKKALVAQISRPKKQKVQKSTPNISRLVLLQYYEGKCEVITIIQITYTYSENTFHPLPKKQKYHS